MPNYTTLTGNGFESRTYYRRPSTNVTRHRWINDTCEACGIIRKKDTGNGMKTYYADSFGRNIGRRVPECKSEIK